MVITDYYSIFRQISLLFFFSLRRAVNDSYLKSRQDFFINNLVFDENADLIAARLLKEFEYSKVRVFNRKNSFNSCNFFLKKHSLLGKFFNYSKSSLVYNDFFINFFSIFKYNHYRSNSLGLISRLCYLEDSLLSYHSSKSNFSRKDLLIKDAQLDMDHFTVDYNVFKKPWVLKGSTDFYTSYHNWSYSTDLFKFVNSLNSSLVRKMLSFHKNSKSTLHESFTSIYYYYGLLKYNNRASYMYSCGSWIVLKNLRKLNPKLLVDLESIDPEKTYLELGLKEDFDKSIRTLTFKDMLEFKYPSYINFIRGKNYSGVDVFLKEKSNFDAYISDKFWKYHYLKYRNFIISFKALNNNFFFFKEFSTSFWDSWVSKSHKGGLYFFFNYRSSSSTFKFFKKVRNIKKNRFKVLKYYNTKYTLLD